MRTNDVFVVSSEVIRDTRLTLAARVLYLIILTDSAATGYCRKTNAEFCDGMGRTPAHITRLISELVKFGYIQRLFVYNKDKPGEIVERKLYTRPEDSALAADTLRKWRRGSG